MLIYGKESMENFGSRIMKNYSHILQTTALRSLLPLATEQSSI